MEIINTIFRLGVILAIFGFIWGLFQMAFVVLSGGQNKSIFVHYGLKSVQYLFLVQVTFLFCYASESDLSLSQNSIVITALILLFYFVSKLQKNQQKGVIFSFIQNGQNQHISQFNIYAEVVLIILALVYFTLCISAPEFASNAGSIWFKESIISIEKAAFFGFIFKVIGFFFLVSVFGKLFQSILLLLAPRTIQNKTKLNSQEDSTHFDDFEDLT